MFIKKKPPVWEALLFVFAFLHDELPPGQGKVKKKAKKNGSCFIKVSTNVGGLK